jgi:hypothetical protein
MNPGRIKKTVGQAKPEHPLDRAFRLHLMIEELRGKTPVRTENAKKIVMSEAGFSRLVAVHALPRKGDTAIKFGILKPQRGAIL